MAENLNLNVNVNTSGAEGSIGSLKKQLREAQNEVVALSDKFGATSAEAIKAATKAAELRDRIGDAKALTDAFNPDAKFKALTASLSGVAGGFGAVQGAMALFGEESEDVQKTLLKVQSAMALSQGLQAIGESVDSFKQLGAVIRTQVVTAFSTLRGAIIATGLGALAVGIGLLVANWDKVVESFKKSFPVLFTIADKFGAIVTKITDFVGITSKAKREQDDLAKKLNNTNRELENQIKVLEAQGGSESEIYKKRKELIENSLKLIVKGSKDEKEQKEKLLTDLKILDINEQKRKQQIIEEQKEEIEKYNEWLLNQELIAFEKRKEQGKKLNKEIIGPDGLTDTERKKKAEDDEKAKADREKATREFNEESEKNGLGKILAIKAKADLDSIKQAEDTAAAKKRIDELEKESKEATAYAISDIVAGLSNAIGQETAAGKAIAIASATIDTYLSASTIFKQASKNPITVVNPAYPYLMAAPAVLGGIARVKQIASVSVPRGGGSSAGMPSMSSAAPMPPQLPMAQTTNLSQQTINDIGNQAVRAYVVESDVTSSQERITAIRQRARFS
jgi:hypothetical protein